MQVTDLSFILILKIDQGNDRAVEKIVASY